MKKEIRKRLLLSRETVQRLGAADLLALLLAHGRSLNTGAGQDHCWSTVTSPAQPHSSYCRTDDCETMATCHG